MITTLSIAGMTCNRCVKHVDAALRAVPGVTAVDVKLAEHQARVVHDPATSPVTALIEAVTRAGYEARAP